MLNRSVLLAASFAVLSLVGSSQANYSVTASGLNPMSFSGGGSTFNFAAPAATQTSAGDFTQNFNVINVGEPTASGTGSGSFTLSEVLTITGPTGTLTGRLAGTFTITGATSTFTNRSFTVLSGGGFDVAVTGYAQPTVGSTAATTPASVGVGNISISVSPVPEPASMAMLGLGLAGLGGVSAYRRRRAR